MVEPWLVITAAHNEAGRLRGLAESLAGQAAGTIARWVIVDDGSTDGTAAEASALEVPFPTTVLSRLNTGGLAGASELGAFREGVTAGLAFEPLVTRIMKIDADIRLRPGHLTAMQGLTDSVGLAGGILEGWAERAQSHHVRGGLRAYSRSGWEVASELPAALGWDILDQVALRSAGLEVRLVPHARAWTVRTTGSSTGLLAGRHRLGVACRWSGYHPAYLVLKLLRTCAQPPRIVGGAAFLRGYLGAGEGPFDPGLLRRHRAEQSQRLRRLLAAPWRGFGLYPSSD